ncbi:hypothetical protein BDZ45DRAFT_585061 [Acephala macrosclerotiorum]|nr:hypothetical protein BDZ45DRAFT_585061 [Acephala macrosclerotiorum]
MPGSFDKLDKETEHDPKEETEHNPKNKSSTHTTYMTKTVQANDAPLWDSVRAAFFSWLTLAGYVVFPGTFTSLKSSQTLAASNGGKFIQQTVKNVPLAVIAGLCCLFGTVGTTWLWYIWRHNAIWLVGHIFLPGLLHSVVGLVTTLVNIYTVQGGHWSVTAKVTVIVIGLCTGNMSLLYLVYNHWILEKMKTPLDREVAKPSHE